MIDRTEEGLEAITAKIDELEALLVPPPSNEEVLATLTALKGAMEQHGIDTKAVDEKIASLGAGLDSHHNS